MSLDSGVDRSLEIMIGFSEMRGGEAVTPKLGL